MLHSFCSIFYRFPLLYVSLHLFLDHVVWFICWWIFGQKYLLIHWIDLIVLCGCKVLRQKLVARFICRDLLNWHFLPITDTSLNNPSMLLAVGILPWVTTKITVQTFCWREKYINLIVKSDEINIMNYYAAGVIAQLYYSEKLKNENTFSLLSHVGKQPQNIGVE